MKSRWTDSVPYLQISQVQNSRQILSIWVNLNFRIIFSHFLNNFQSSKQYEIRINNLFLDFSRENQLLSELTFVWQFGTNRKSKSIVILRTTDIFSKSA